jgi:predicted DCC family thiol-disulfide oxidoreductase YuxK
MTDVAPQGRSAAAGTHLLLYDGLCVLCSRFLQFLLAHDDRAAFNVASLHSATGHAMVKQCGGNPRELSSFYVFADYRTPNRRVLRKSDAALFVARELGWPWKAACLLGVLPKRLLDNMYGVVARSRYRAFGRCEQCMMPRPEFRDRFLD